MAAFFAQQWNDHIREFRQSLEHIDEHIAETLGNIQLRILSIKQIPDSETEKDVAQLMGRTVKLCASISETLNGTLSTHNQRVAHLSKEDEGGTSAVPPFHLQVRKEQYLFPLRIYHEKLDMVCDVLESICIVQK
jgi:hypothetical protein